MYHMGYYLNRYALWYRVEHFNSAIELVRWLKTNADKIDGNIDFISDYVVVPRSEQRQMWKDKYGDKEDI